MRKIFVHLFILSVLFAYSVDFEDLPVFMEDPVVDDEISRPEFAEFMQRFGDDYGYNNTIDDIRENDMKRMKGAVYLDYTGSGMYRESQVQKCNDLLLNGLYGNAHSRSPSSLNTEHLVFYIFELFIAQVENMRERILKYFRASPSEYSIVFTSGATGALHTVGEIFPWSKDSEFYYLSEVCTFSYNNKQNHNSVLGIREYAFRFGSGFRALNEEELPKDESCTIEYAEECKNLMGRPDKNFTYSLFAYPAEDNFAGVKYPLSWIKKVQEGYFHNVINPLLIMIIRVNDGQYYQMQLLSFQQIVQTYQFTSQTL